LLVAGIVSLARTTHGDTPPDVPPPSTPWPSEDILAAANATTVAADNADQQAMQDAQNHAVATHQTKTGHEQDPNLTPITDPTPALGIDIGPSPRAGWGSQYHLMNGWEGVVNGVLTYVFAGSQADDIAMGVWKSPEQGVVNVEDTTTNAGTDYLAPTRTGKLQIISYTGTCLALVSIANTTYAFDVATHAWSCGPPSYRKP